MSTAYALGREEKLFVVAESTYGAAAAAPAATDALRFLEASFTQAIERAPRDDKRATRSLLELIQRRKTVDWSVSGYLLPSGAAGTAPDGWDELLTAGFGTETINAGVSVVYTLALEGCPSLTLHRAFGLSSTQSQGGEMIRGAVVSSVNFALSGSDEAKVTVSGFAADVLRAGVGTVSTDDGSDVVLAEADRARAFDAGMYVDVDSESGLLISAVDEGTNTLTMAAHTAQTAADPVVPSVVPLAQTFAAGASPIAGILGSTDLDSSSFNIISAEINVSNNDNPHNDRYGSDKTTSFNRGNRSVTGNMVVRLTDTNFVDIARTKNNELRDLQIVSGTSAGSIATFDLNQVNFDYSAINPGGPEDIQVTLPFTALASSAEDELTLTLT
jgi:hypothetical protein